MDWLPSRELLVLAFWLCVLLVAVLRYTRRMDDDGRELDLNGLPFSMTIELSTIRNNGVQEYLPHGDRAQV